ncbi:hypothetical protein RclHR1_01620017 [Rhizophagus clarus]|uniref:Uncharacterized protein n=1 Tax=Rhizophagus clarus TaxID=94130 RepID=A0A2Z6QIL7_9GLOM|nr:hypothetical protein RclHR1_01620017 [Rhizophagus clarus]
MPPDRRRNILPLGRDSETTKEIVRTVRESAAQTVQDFVLALEDFMLNGISTLNIPSLQIKYYNNGYTRPQILKEGNMATDQRLSDFENGYFILFNYRKQIKNHLQNLFPRMSWKIELGSNFIGVTIAKYGLIDDIFPLKAEAVKNDNVEEEEKEDKKKM